MQRPLISRLALMASLLLTTLGSASAEESGLRALNTGDDGRGWEAVGRLNLDGRGFCTGALVAEDLVLTAAHCLFDKQSGLRFDPTRIEFLAGWRNGRAAAYRQVRRAVVPPTYQFDADVTPERVRDDVALLELYQPIRNTSVVPFNLTQRPRQGDEISVVSYAHDRAETPSLQELCNVITSQEGVLIMSCEVDFGSSGAPVFSLAGGVARIVSVVSAKAEVEGNDISLGTDLGQIEHLMADLRAGGGSSLPVAPRTNRITIGQSRAAPIQSRSGIGAKFIRPGN